MGTNLTRRQLLVLAQGGVAAGAFGGCAVLRGGASHPVLAADKQSLEGNALRIPVSQLAAVGPGQVLEVKPGAGRPDVLLLGAPQGGPWHVVTAHCTHRGCIVGWNATAAEWQCPCHGSRFAPGGEVVAGPAERPLASPPLRVDGDTLVIDLDGLKA